MRASSEVFRSFKDCESSLFNSLVVISYSTTQTLKITKLCHLLKRIKIQQHLHVEHVIRNEWIRSDSSQLFFRCYCYFASAGFVVQCISVGYQEQDLVA